MTAHHPIMSGVRFKDIVDFPGYCIGEDGPGWSLWNWGGSGPSRGVMGSTWRRLKGTTDKDGYISYLLVRKGSRAKHHFAHRLVLEAFVGPCPVGLLCCHADGNPANNRLSNLRWDTQAANVEDAKRHGTHHVFDNRGERNGRRKLTEVTVLEMRRLSDEGVPRDQLRLRFGVGKTTVNYVVRRLIWTHI